MADETQQQTNGEQKQETALVPVSRTTPMREMLTILKETGDTELFKAFAHDIIEREVAAARFGEDGRLARIFADSGVFDGINGSAQGVSLAMTKIQLGRSWRMEPADAMENINFINGRPSVATRYLAAKMQDAGITWDIEWSEDDKGNCTGCSLHLKRWNPEANRYDPIIGRVNGVEKQAVVSFTKKDAETAIIHEKGKEIRLIDKWNFKSWASDMYFARCVSRVRVRYAANILSGILTREEAEDSGESNGGPATASPGSARAALASASKIEEIGDRLEKSKPAADAAPEEKSAEMPSQGEKAPWKNRIEMHKFMTPMAEMVERGGIGKSEFDHILARHGQEWAKMQWDSAEALACYREMEKVRAEVKNTPNAETAEKPLF